jgi:hypothetical protein
MTYFLTSEGQSYNAPLDYETTIRDRLRDLDLPPISLRSHEPPRNSGEGTAVNGPMPLEGKGDALERP